MRIEMFKILLRCVTIACVLVPFAASAGPTKLKLSFSTSDRSNLYRFAIKPVVDAVNAEAKGLIDIEVYFSGALGKSQSQQPQLVVDGVADIAFVVPGMTPERFHDNAVIELPGLFRDLREATLVYTRLVEANRLKGYEDFFVIGAYASEPESLHACVPLTALDSLKGKKMRVNNAIEGLALEKLGSQPVVMPVNLIAESIGSGKIDGAAVPLSALLEFGIGRVATHHYFLRTSSAPLALLMNRKKFESLPVQAQTIIRKYSGEWAAARFIEGREALERSVMSQLQADGRRNFIFPSRTDQERADAVFKATIADATDKNPHTRELLKIARSEIAKLRSSE
jgi:TRAP-type C4-dicarboxylate transport system substrate-binding protein